MSFNNQLFLYIPIVLLLFLIVIIFILILTTWVRVYFNKNEPVYVRIGDSYVKNYIASRFCRMVISNHVKDQCLNDIENIKIWLLILRTHYDEYNNCRSIHNLHDAILFKIRERITYKQYANLKINLDNIELSLNSNLDISKIPSPPYFSLRTYLKWVNETMYN